jgi:hypothetical protein
MKNRLLLLVLLLSLALSGSAFAGANIVIVNVNAPGVGFNDPTPAAPVGGNTGTTIGQQRLIAFQYAANIWGSTLDSGVTIYIQAQFTPLSCTATAATLGSAGTIIIVRDFTNAEYPATWYHQALANKRAGFDVSPGPNGTNADDLRANFNSNLGNPGCLTGTFWYYGLDGNHGTNIDLVAVLLHEFAHGLGFSQFASVTSGAQTQSLPDVYNRRLFDMTQNRFWPEMTNAQRVASAINTNRVVWTGPEVTAALPGVLNLGTPLLTVHTPAGIAGNYLIGAAAFGPSLVSPGVSGSVVAALDDANVDGPSNLDGCTAITNASEVAGKIAIINRGTCGFVVKVKNAQNAGAIAVIIHDNAAGSPPAGLGGADPTIVIPSARVTLADGNTIRAQLGAGVTVTLGVNPAVYAGADALGRGLLYTPNPVQSGSSISHWDTSAFPNQLMEPAINADLTHNVRPPFDLTLPLLRDIGWYADADLDLVPDGNDNCPFVSNPDQADVDGDGIGDVCDPDNDNDGVPNASDNCPLTPNPDQADFDQDGIGDACDADKDNDGVANDVDACPYSDTRATIKVGACDSGVGNTLFANGCSVSDLIGNIAAGSENHGNFVSGVSSLTNQLVADGIISAKMKGAVQACSAKAQLP